jgi:photosystem II stability/assembly factor-like uncharacterized protein
VPELPQAAAGSFLDSRTARVLFYVPRSQGREVQPLDVWSTEDGGATWSQSHAADMDFVGLASLVPLVRFVDPKHGWILVRYGGVGMHKHPVALMATVDGGETWDMKMDYWSSDLHSCTKTGMAFGDSSVGFATIANCPIAGAELDWTYDGGSTWEAHMPWSPADQPDLLRNSACDAHSPQFVSASRAFAAADCRTGEQLELVTLLFSSSDSGSTWESRPYPGGSLLFIDPNTGWALSRDIFRTTDAGHHWEWVKTVNWDGQFSFVRHLKAGRWQARMERRPWYTRSTEASPGRCSSPPSAPDSNRRQREISLEESSDG